MVVLYHDFQYKKQKEIRESFRSIVNTCYYKYDTAIHAWPLQIISN